MKRVTILFITLAFFLFFGIATVVGLFAPVRTYLPLIKTDLKRYHLETYTPVLAALMQQESRGKGGDPMQASECVGLPPNTIKDPKQSIHVGVDYFRKVLLYANRKNVDFSTVIQSYNMGIGYIDFVSSHGGKHSEELAKQFSLMQVRKHPAIYTCSSRYPYCYGDVSYSTKVVRKIQWIKLLAFGT